MHAGLASSGESKAPGQLWLFRVAPRIGAAPAGVKQEANPMAAASQAGKQSRTLKRATPKVGRNDPCPCGSGKKYKKCCGRNQ